MERLLELLVQVTVDILAHQLAERGKTPTSYRETCLRAGRLDLIPDDLAACLADAAGPRNIPRPPHSATAALSPTCLSPRSPA